MKSQTKAGSLDVQFGSEEMIQSVSIYPVVNNSEKHWDLFQYTWTHINMIGFGYGKYTGYTLIHVYKTIQISNQNCIIWLTDAYIYFTCGSVISYKIKRIHLELGSCYACILGNSSRYSTRPTYGPCLNFDIPSMKLQSYWNKIELSHSPVLCVS